MSTGWLLAGEGSVRVGEVRGVGDRGGGSYWEYGQYRGFLTESGDISADFRPSVFDRADLRAWVRDEDARSEALREPRDEEAGAPPNFQGVPLVRSQDHARQVFTPLPSELKRVRERARQSMWFDAELRLYWKAELRNRRSSKRRMGLCAQSGCFRMGAIPSEKSLYCRQHDPLGREIVCRLLSNGDYRMVAFVSEPSGGRVLKSRSVDQVRRGDVPQHRFSLGELTMIAGQRVRDASRMARHRRWALRWYLLAAADGNRDALFCLGRHAAEEGDYAEAETWWVGAARLGDAVAAGAMGSLFWFAENEAWKGDVVEWRADVDRVDCAKRWFRYAIKLGHRPSEDDLRRLESVWRWGSRSRRDRSQ